MLVMDKGIYTQSIPSSALSPLNQHENPDLS